MPDTETVKETDGDTECDFASAVGDDEAEGLLVSSGVGETEEDDTGLKLGVPILPDSDGDTESLGVGDDVVLWEASRDGDIELLLKIEDDDDFDGDDVRDDVRVAPDSDSVSASDAVSDADSDTE